MAKQTKTSAPRPNARLRQGNKKRQLGNKRRAAKRKVDPVVTEIVRNGVIAVTEEMKTNLMRTAYNIIIYEALDFTTGLFTPQGETISIGIGLPMFIRGMAETVKAKIKHFGAENIRPGDIYVTNDSYLTGSHLNHVTLTLPIFYQGKLVAFSCCMAHWLDIGGILGGMSTDIFSEGLQIPILKYQDRGVVNQTVVDIIRQNVRLPSRAMGDLRAQVTAVKTGERRFLQLLERYGRAAVLGFDHRDHGPRRGDGARAHAHDSGRRLRGGILHGRRRHRHRQEGADPRACRGQGRRNDCRPERGVEAGARLLQFRHHHRLCLRPGRLQMPDLAHGLSHQRRLVPQPQDHRAAGPGDQRGASGADALVDDLSDDHRRYDLQGAGAGDSRPRDRRPPR